MTLLNGGELILYGFVGDSLWGEGFTAQDVVNALYEHGRANDITVRINSGGGYTDDGIAIFNALKSHGGAVHVAVDGVAASSASVIAMAGDDITLRTGALMMIHEPWGWQNGTAEAHEGKAEVLNKIGDQFAQIYAERAKGSVEDMRALMKKETWMDAEEAVAFGFADQHEDQKSISAAAFDYRAYACAPEELSKRAAMMKWNMPQGVEAAAVAASTRLKEEPKMADNELKEATTKGATDERTRMAAILDSDEAKANPGLAHHLAFSTETDAKAAKSILAAAGQSAGEKPATEPVPQPVKAPAASYEADRQQDAVSPLPQGGASGETSKLQKSLSRSDIFAHRKELMKG